MITKGWKLITKTLFVFSNTNLVVCSHEREKIALQTWNLAEY